MSVTSTCGSSGDVTLGWGLAENAQNLLQLILDPRFLGQIPTCDVLSALLPGPTLGSCDSVHCDDALSKSEVGHYFTAFQSGEPFVKVGPDPDG